MTDDCLPRLRVFLDASLLVLLIFTTLALHRRATRQETPPKIDDGTLYNYQRPPFRRSIAIAMLTFVAWGILGLVLTLQQDCSTSHWLVVLCLSLSGGCLLVGTWLGIREALLTIDFDVRHFNFNHFNMICH
ncbi:hypothetical protein PHMEG_00030294 [Phytophthora megakarya]|uniref:Transmembrane protein n=1 Tax=Phytophthora megakarya TaxID=4795 RepID=A0A225V254_9STRA|nr:hypothetical protein PHMEG_00030294 [Phytophthora megakarya]